MKHASFRNGPTNQQCLNFTDYSGAEWKLYITVTISTKI